MAHHLHSQKKNMIAAESNSFLSVPPAVQFDNGFALNFGFKTKDPEYKKPIYGIPLTLNDFDMLAPFMFNDYGKARAKVLLNPEQSAYLDNVHNNMLLPAVPSLFGENAKVSKPHWNGEFQVTFPKTRPVDGEMNGKVEKWGLAEVVKLLLTHTPREMQVKLNVWASKRDDDQVVVGYYATLQKITF